MESDLEGVQPLLAIVESEGRVLVWTLGKWQSCSNTTQCITTTQCKIYQTLIYTKRNKMVERFYTYQTSLSIPCGRVETLTSSQRNHEPLHVDPSYWLGPETTYRHIMYVQIES